MLPTEECGQTARVTSLKKTDSLSVSRYQMQIAIPMDQCITYSLSEKFIHRFAFWLGNCWMMLQ